MGFSLRATAMREMRLPKIPCGTQGPVYLHQTEAERVANSRGLTLPTAAIQDQVGGANPLPSSFGPEGPKVSCQADQFAKAGYS